MLEVLTAEAVGAAAQNEHSNESICLCRSYICTKIHFKITTTEKQGENYYIIDDDLLYSYYVHVILLDCHYSFCFILSLHFYIIDRIVECNVDFTVPRMHKKLWNN